MKLKHYIACAVFALIVLGFFRFFGYSLAISLLTLFVLAIVSVGVYYFYYRMDKDMER